MAKTVIWVFIAFLRLASSQTLRQYSNNTIPNQGICISKPCPTLRMFQEHYRDCIVVVGTLKLTLLETMESKDFEGVSFPNLREVTEFLVFYRVMGLHSLGQLFPNLARIRGEKLLNNYALIIHDMMNLKEIGLYGLLKIDRGGVIIWGVPEACFVNDADWTTIAPHSRVVISSQDPMAGCLFRRCTCSLNPLVNHCWNNRKCQIYLEGPEADKCHEQCFGCRKTRQDECSLCRHYTYNGKCVSKCPSNTIVLPSSQYCVTKEECDNLDGWVWNNTCVFHCPSDYKEQTTARGTSCVYDRYNKTCQSLDLRSVSNLQDAEGCVYINGSLEIHIRPVPDVMKELTRYLNRIEEVTNYVAIYSSTTITSLNFLSSLKKIEGQKLKHNEYSLIIQKMANLKTLFTPNVIQTLKIDRGTLKVNHNPVLCRSHIDQILPLFPVRPNNETDIPIGMNGYSGDCDDGVNFQVRIINATNVVILYSTLADPDAHYTVLYVRIPRGAHQNFVPESCSDAEWYAVNGDTSFGHQFGMVELTSLRPASAYAICIETYDPANNILARSSIYNFTTPTGIPEPPFIKQLVANTSSTVDINWVGHRYYLPFIKYYSLEVSLIEIYEKDLSVKDQCKHFEYHKFDYRHVVVMKPPPEYATCCQDSCKFISNVTEAMQEHFDVCSSINCHGVENEVSHNSTFGKYVRTLVLNLDPSNTCYRVGGLAPFRDYKVSLRACTETECSRSASELVRTLPSEAINADVPSYFRINKDTISHGNISIEWGLPKVTNGLILSFTVEILPELDQGLPNVLPLQWCVLSNVTSIKVMTVTVNKYFIRVCTRSIAIDAACTDWKRVDLSHRTWWWTAVLFAAFLYIASFLAGSIARRRSESIDLQPILESSDSVGQSEPPSKMFSDFSPMYEIPLRDTRLE